MQARDDSPSLWTQIQEFLQKESGSTAFQFLKGASVGMTAALGGVPAVIGMGAGWIAAGMVKTETGKSYLKKSLLNIYRHEIMDLRAQAGLSYKPKAELTVADMEEAARATQQPNAISAELDAMQHNSRASEITGIISTAIITGLLAAAVMTISPALLQAAPPVIAVATSILAKFTHIVIDDRVTHMIGKREHQPHNANVEINGLMQHLKQQAATPERVFGVLAALNPDLQQAIRKRFGDDYKHLTIMAKREAIDAFEPQYHAKTLTQAINEQAIRPTQLGLIAYRKPASLADAGLPESPAPIATDAGSTIHQERLLTQRSSNDLSPSPRLH